MTETTTYALDDFDDEPEPPYLVVDEYGYVLAQEKSVKSLNEVVDEVEERARLIERTYSCVVDVSRDGDIIRVTCIPALDRALQQLAGEVMDSTLNIGFDETNEDKET
jgi:hypothetical protein